MAVAVVAGLSAVGGQAITVGLAQFTLAMATKAFVLGAGLSMISRALQPKLEVGQDTGLTTSVSNPIAERPIIYGRTRTGGTIVYFTTSGSDSKFLHLVIAVAGHAIDGYEKVYFDDQVIWEDGSYVDDWVQNAQINFHDGTQTTADQDLINASNEWNSNCILNDTAYIHVRLEYDPEVYTNGIPSITTTIRGKKVYDPRTDVTEWSENPALCIYDYLQDPKYGLNDDTVNLAQVIASANVCDQLVTIDTDVDQTRYALSGFISTGDTVKANIEKMLSSMFGRLVCTGGELFINAGYYTLPVLDIDESMLVGEVSLQTKTSRRNTYNAVKGTFLSEEENYIFADYPSIKSDTYSVEDGEPLYLDLPLPCTTNNVRAQRLAKLSLNKSRQQRTLSIPVNLAGLKVRAGDVIRFTSERLGISNAEYEVIDFEFEYSDQLIVNLVCVETGSSLYDWTVADKLDFSVGSDITLYDGSAVAPTDLTATAVSNILSDGTDSTYIDVAWTNPSDIYFDYVVLKYGDQSIVTKDQSYRINNVDENTQYTITISAYNTFGRQSAGLSTNVTTVRDTTAPANITNITATGGLQSIDLSWTNPSDDDFDLVRIKVASDNDQPDGYSYEVRADNFTDDVGAYSATRYYWLAPVDRTGNVGNYVSGGSATTGSIDYSDVLNPPAIPEVATTAYLTLSDSNAPTDTEFNTAVGRDPIENDFVVVSYEALVEGETVTRTKAYVYKTVSPAEVPDWTEVAEYIDGSMLVSGSLSASDITTGTLNASVVTIENLEIGYGSVTDTPDLSVYLTDGDIEDFVTLEDVNQSNFSPYQSWDFQNTADGWSTGGITTTNNTDFISLASDTTDPTFAKGSLSIDGGLYDTVLVRIRRTAGTGWQGTLYYGTSGHGASESYRQIVSDTTVLNEWVILTYDMHNLNAGGDDWKNNTITYLRFDWGNGSPNDEFDVDWIAVGKRGSVPIGKYDINANVTSISGGVIQTGTAVTVGTGDNVAVLSGADATYRLWAGDATSTGAPFAVTQTGVLNATGAIIDGNITATSLDVEDATVTGTFIAPIGWSNNVYSGVINRGNLNESVKDLIDERIAEVTGGISGDFGQEEGSFSYIAQGNPDPVNPIVENITHENGKDLTVELSGNRSWNREFIGLPDDDMDVTIILERSPADADTWTTLATLTQAGDSITTSRTQLTGTTYAYSVSIYHVLTDDQASGNYDYRARTTVAGSAYNVGIPLQLTVVEPATVGAGNADTLDNEDGTYYLDYNNFTNTPSLSSYVTQTDIDNSISSLVDSAPSTLDTLNELASALGDDANFSTTVTNSIATKASKAGDTFTGDVTFNTHIKLPQNPVGTTYGNGVSTIPTSMITQVVGTNDGWRLYGEGASNDVKMIFEVIDDIETGDTWVFRNKKTYGDYTATEPFKIQGNGNIIATGTITASGYNKSNWDTAYTYSQVGHLPLTGGTLSGDLNFSAQANRAIKIDTTVADNETRDAIELFENDESATGRQAISWWNDNQNYYKARLWTEVGDSFNATQFGIDVADDTRAVATRLYIRNGDTQIVGNLGINGTTVIDSSRNLKNISAGTYKANIGTASFSWSGSGNYPTIYSSHPDRWVMICNPHIPYLKNGTRGFTGTTVGSSIHHQTATDNFWVTGVLSSVSTEGYSIRLASDWAFLINETDKQVNARYGLKINSIETIDSSRNFDGLTMRLSSSNDLSLSSTNHAFQVGSSAGINLAIDNNEIMARNNGAVSPLALNADGGEVSVGNNNVADADFKIKRGALKIGDSTVIDKSRNLTNIVTLNVPSNGGTNSITSGTGDGATYSTYNFKINGWNGMAMHNPTVGGPYANQITGVYNFRAGTWDTKGGYRVNGTTVIDSSRNLVNIANITATGAVNLNRGANNALFIDTTVADNTTRPAIKLFENTGQASGRQSIQWFNGNQNYVKAEIWTEVGAGYGATKFGIDVANNARAVATRLYFDNGNAIFSGNVTAYSDKRLKSDIKTLDGSKVYQMRGVSFTKDGELGSGVIAQEMEQIAPELVLTNDDEMQTKSVAYGNVVGYLIEAIKELKAEIEELKK